ncbi:TPA: hypothetical protein HA351_03650 [Methanosarcinaceae archaeon]|nr:hypothetical protein [Methanosarcinaceae archaeon]
MNSRFLTKLFALALILVLLSFSGCVDNNEDDRTPENESIGQSEAFVYGTASVEEVQVEMKKTVIPPEISISVKGNLPDGCTGIDRKNITMEKENGNITIGIPTIRPADAVYTEALVPFEEKIPLDVEGFEVGNYTVSVNGAETSFELTAYDIVAPGETYTPGKAAVEDVTVIMTRSIPPQVRAVVSGMLAGNCERIDVGNISIERQDRVILVELPTLSRENAPCTMNLVPFTEYIPINIEGLEPGEYTVSVNGVNNTFVLGDYGIPSLPSEPSEPSELSEPSENASGEDMETYGLIEGNILFEDLDETIEDVTVYIRLDDVSLADARSTVISETVIENVSVSPEENKVPFTLGFPELVANRTYSLYVHVDVNGDGKVSKGDYVTTMHNGVPTDQDMVNMDVTVERV